MYALLKMLTARYRQQKQGCNQVYSPYEYFKTRDIRNPVLSPKN